MVEKDSTKKGKKRRKSKLADDLYEIFTAPGDDPIIDLDTGLPATVERLREAAYGLAEKFNELREEYRSRKFNPQKITLH